MCALFPFSPVVGKLRVAGKRRQLPGVKNDQHANNTDGSGGENGQTTFISPQVNGYITEVKVQDFVQVKKGDLLLQIF
jgi:multidrug efflux pump subunit AcrA (membrane-fusion protein)